LPQHLVGLQIGDFGKQNAVGKKRMGKQIGTVCSMQRIFVADSADELMRNTHDFLSPFGETNRICQVLPCSTMQCASNTPTWTQRLQNKF